jgi:hypothetical protein
MGQGRKAHNSKGPGGIDREGLDLLVLCLVKACVRDTLEDLHAGITPTSKTGDYSDVKVISPFGEIPWNEVSRISDEEMKALMIGVVNRVFTFLIDPALCINSFSMPSGWNKPAIDEEFQQGFKMLAAGSGKWLKSE